MLQKLAKAHFFLFLLNNAKNGIQIIEKVIPMRTNITLFFYGEKGKKKKKKKTEKEDNKSDYVGQNLHLEFLQYKIKTVTVHTDRNTTGHFI